MTIADAFLAILIVIAGLAGLRVGATGALVSASGASAGLLVGARLADEVGGGGSGHQVVAAIVLLGCGAIGLAGGRFLRAASHAEVKRELPAVVRRQRRRRWVAVGKVGLTLLVGVAAGFIIARATESSNSTLASSSSSLPGSTAAGATPTTAAVRTTDLTISSPSSTVVTATIGPVTTSIAPPPPPPTAAALTVTSPGDGTVVPSNRVTLSGTAQPGVVVRVGTAAVTTGPDAAWRLVVRLAEGANQLVVTDGSTSVTLTIVSNPPPRSTTSTAPPTTAPRATTTTIAVDTEPPS